MNDDLELATLEELESRCHEEDLRRIRFLPRESEVYRRMLISSLTPQPDLPIRDLLTILREGFNPIDDWHDAITLFRRSVPTPPWECLSKPDIGEDVTRAVAWLTSQCAEKTKATGVYLGLDTLNMHDGAGRNLEIGFSDICNPEEASLDWIYNGLRYGQDHLICSLVWMRDEYSKEAWKVPDPSVPLGSPAEFADYMIMLGYSGLILREAMRQSPPLPAGLIVWGFHDGDLFRLGRLGDRNLEMVCE